MTSDSHSRSPHPAVLEPAESATPIPHASPLSLALELDEADDDRIDEVYRRIRGCETCMRGLETLAFWLTALDHWSPRVGPEFLTRYRLVGDVFAAPESHPRRLARVHTDELFHHWGLFRFLLEESRRALLHAPSHAFELAELAVAVAEGLELDFYGARWVADARALAYARLSQVCRRIGSLELARQQLHASRVWLEAGTGRSGISRQVHSVESLSFSDPGSRDEIPGFLEDPDERSHGFSHQPPNGPVQRLLDRCRAASRPPSTASRKHS